MVSENTLADPLALPQGSNLVRGELLNRRKAGFIEAPHGLFVDDAGLIKAAGGFMDGCSRLAPVNLRFFHDSTSSISLFFRRVFNSSSVRSSMTLANCLKPLHIGFVYVLQDALCEPVDEESLIFLAVEDDRSVAAGFSFLWPGYTLLYNASAIIGVDVPGLRVLNRFDQLFIADPSLLANLANHLFLKILTAARPRTPIVFCTVALSSIVCQSGAKFQYSTVRPVRRVSRRSITL